MSKKITVAQRESIERDLGLIESLIRDMRQGLDDDMPVPLKKYAQCIAMIACSTIGVLEEGGGDGDE